MVMPQDALVTPARAYTLAEIDRLRELIAEIGRCGEEATEMQVRTAMMAGLDVRDFEWNLAGQMDAERAKELGRMQDDAEYIERLRQEAVERGDRWFTDPEHPDVVGFYIKDGEKFYFSPRYDVAEGDMLPPEECEQIAKPEWYIDYAGNETTGQLRCTHFSLDTNQE